LHSSESTFSFTLGFFLFVYSKARKTEGFKEEFKKWEVPESNTYESDLFYSVKLVFTKFLGKNIEWVIMENTKTNIGPL